MKILFEVTEKAEMNLNQSYLQQFSKSSNFYLSQVLSWAQVTSPKSYQVNEALNISYSFGHLQMHLIKEYKQQTLSSRQKGDWASKAWLGCDARHRFPCEFHVFILGWL